MSQQKSNEMKFEEAVIKIEEIIEQLETGSLTLEENLNIFKEAISLIKACHQELDWAEKQIQMLINTDNGLKLTELNFEEEVSL